MTGASAVILPCGKRLHLHHGPIDLIIGVDQNARQAFEAAAARFETVLEELVAELPELRSPLSRQTNIPNGEIANKMHQAVMPYCHDHFVTRMIAVAGAVADTILKSMRTASVFSKAYVNNGGDIAIHLEGGQRFVSSISAYDGRELGRISITDNDKTGGIATSGRHGRSFSLGIADSVTVLASSAAEADVAATLIANEVDLPDHPLISRCTACSLAPDSDLGEKMVVTDCKKLSFKDQSKAILRGEAKAKELFDRGLIKGAVIFLQDENRIIDPYNLTLFERKRQYA